MDRLRWVVVLIILAALAGGVATRFLYASSDGVESNFEIRTPSDSEGIRVVGTFIDPFNSLTGYEISFPRCPRPVAVLPVPTGISAVAPKEHLYGNSSRHVVSYIYNGGVYPEAGIGPRLRLLRILYRLGSLFGLTDARSFAFYLKIWVPEECEGVSMTEAGALQHSLIGRIQPKSL